MHGFNDILNGTGVFEILWIDAFSGHLPQSDHQIDRIDAVDVQILA
jgi:hypothetical protein